MNAEHPLPASDSAPSSPSWPAVHLSGYSRWMGLAKLFVISLVLSWIALTVVLQWGLGNQLRRRARARLAVALAVPLTGWITYRRYAGQVHTLRCTEREVEFISVRGVTTLDAGRVQGIVGAGGISFEGAAVIWKRILLVVDGELHTVGFDKDTNAACYALLRQTCGHAWGLPFGGELEPPFAGAELHPDEYVEALEHVRRHVLSLTRKYFSTGSLMVLGSGVALSAVVQRLLHGEHVPHFTFRAMIWLIVLLLMGLVLAFRAVRQFLVVNRIRHIEDRLRGQVG